MRVTSYQTFGNNMLLLGRLEDAERYFRRGVEALDRLGETGFNSTLTALLANTLCDLGRWDEAEPLVERSRELAAPDDFASQVVWRTARARILSFRGRAEEALALADEAVKIVDPTDYLDLKAGVHQIRGEILEACGRTKEARAELEHAVRDFERKGSVPAMERVRRRLEELPA
jgi:tetratricopeptide (TPR) repeat protein